MSATASIGPISGINYGQLIAGLISIDQQPIEQAQAQIATVSQQSNALLGLSAELASLSLSATSFSSAAIFQAAAATSSNPSVMGATAAAGTPTGAYTFSVQQLASTSQVVTQGFASATTALGVAGNITFGIGGGDMSSPQLLANLNGGQGIGKGSIRITDRSGEVDTVDLSQAVNIQDVVDDINGAGDVNVAATIQGDHLVLTDNSGGTGNLTVSNVGTGTTATDLGLAGSATSSTLTSTDLTKLGAASTLNSLNDGNGVRTAGVLSDFQIATSGGTIQVSLNGANTVGDVLADINAAGNINGTQYVTASLTADGHGIQLTDQNSSFTPTVTALNGSLAARDLGLTTGTSAPGSLTGDRINAGLNSDLLRELNGGSGVDLGTITITDRTGTVHSGIDLSGAKTVADVLNIINSAGAGVQAAISGSGSAITLTDTTGGTGALTVADGSTGAAATGLGLAQSVNAATLTGTDLHPQYISYNTRLDSLSGALGGGFQPGKIQLTDSTGASFTVDLSGAGITTIGDVLNQINNNSTGIRASINATGDGILLTDSTNGGLTASVADVNGGTTAESLNIGGSFTNGQLDGSLQRSVAIANTDTLQNIATKINNAGIGVLASVINDGSNTPYRLSLVSRYSGATGSLVVDGSALGLQSNTLIAGQDAVVSYGTGATSLQATSSDNTFSNLVNGLTLNLTGTGTASVTVASDTSQISSTVQSFVDSYNTVINNIASLTSFDANDPTNLGVLFGNSTVEQIQNALGNFVSRAFSGVGAIKTLAGVGITVNQDGTLSLDTDQLSSILASDPNDVRSLFTTLAPTSSTANSSQGGTAVANPNSGGVGAVLSNILSQFTDAQTGTIFEATDALATETTDLNNRVTFLNQLLTAKQNRLVQQMANLEVTIAQLQQQGSAISNFKPVTTSSTSTTTSS